MKRRVLASRVACAGFALIGVGLIAAAPGNPGIFSPNSTPYGQSYAEWSANWWQWAMGLPVAWGDAGPECSESTVPSHPFLDCPDFDVTEGQSGQVWFLAGVFGEVERTCTIPKGKALFVALLNAEWSSLEDPFPQTEEGQRELANLVADFIVPESLSCTLDGVPVANLSDDFRFESAQFSFEAPDDGWIFGPPGTGGKATAVADGYFVFLKPLSVGHHVLHYTGGFDFDGDDVIDLSMDMTYNLDVVAAQVGG